MTDDADAAGPAREGTASGLTGPDDAPSGAGGHPPLVDVRLVLAAGYGVVASAAGTLAGPALATAAGWGRGVTARNVDCGRP